MNEKERVFAVLNQEKPDRVPRHTWTLPSIHMFRQHEYDLLQKQYPDDVGSAPKVYGRSRYARGNAYHVGTYTDEWGAIWEVGEPGVTGEVKKPPLADWKALDSYRIPWELLDDANFLVTEDHYRNSSQFVLATTHTRPFERLQFLRGTENVYMDLAYGAPELLQLKEMLHEFSLRELSQWGDSAVDGVAFIDDWGSQSSLLISPEMWREHFKPMYAQYVDILHGKGKKVFFHSDGNIELIIPDLIEIGIDALNSQLFCMDLEKIGQEYAGKITFWGEIDRQHVLPFGSRQEIRDAVERVYVSLVKNSETGVIAQCEWGTDVSMEAIAVVYEAWLAKMRKN